MDSEASELAEHYRKQATRLRRMSLFLGGAELKASLRAAARMYEGFAQKLEDKMDAQAMKAWRARLGVTQEKAAKALGVTRRVVAGWESGLTPIPKMTVTSVKVV
jgi:DNA-binding transcriptional regulator YiaG